MNINSGPFNAPGRNQQAMEQPKRHNMGVILKADTSTNCNIEEVVSNRYVNTLTRTVPIARAMHSVESGMPMSPVPVHLCTFTI